jgi:hypothetical protein
VLSLFSLTAFDRSIDSDFVRLLQHASRIAEERRHVAGLADRDAVLEQHDRRQRRCVKTRDLRRPVARHSKRTFEKKTTTTNFDRFQQRH